MKDTCFNLNRIIQLYHKQVIKAFSNDETNALLLPHIKRTVIFQSLQVQTSRTNMISSVVYLPGLIIPLMSSMIFILDAFGFNPGSLVISC